MRRWIPLLAWLCLAHGSCEDGHVEPYELDGACSVDTDAATEIAGDDRASESGTYRVLSGGSLYVSGPSVDVIVEAGGSVDLSGPDARAWVRSGGSVVAWSEGTSVWFEEGADVFGSNEKVVWMRCTSLE